MFSRQQRPTDPQLTVAMKSTARCTGQPPCCRSAQGMRVRFPSDRPKVVSVTKIQTVANGAATGTADRHIPRLVHLPTGNSSSASCPSRAPSRSRSPLRKRKARSRRTARAPPRRLFSPPSSQISSPTTFLYRAPVPGISATTPDKRAHATEKLGKSGRLPGTARTGITGPDGITQTYSLYLPARSPDTFMLQQRRAAVDMDPAGTGVLESEARRPALQIETEQGPPLWRHAVRQESARPAGALEPDDHHESGRCRRRQLYRASRRASSRMRTTRTTWKLHRERLAPRRTRGDDPRLPLRPRRSARRSPGIPSPAGSATTPCWLRMVKRGPHDTTFFSATGYSWAPIYSTPGRVSRASGSGCSPGTGSRHDWEICMWRSVISM